MSDSVEVLIHESAFPERFESGLHEAFVSRRIDPKFHYVSARQSRAWMALSRAYSPFAADPDGTSVYDSAFHWAADRLPDAAVQVTSLACGGAQKEARLIGILRQAGREVRVTIADASVALVVTAYRHLKENEGPGHVNAIVIDLMTADDLGRVLSANDSGGAPRIVTCFGLLPSVDPMAIGSRLAALLRKEDVLLVSANLALESEYQQSVERALAEYDNSATRDWLLLLMLDCGFERGDGEIVFGVERSAELPALLRFSASFRVLRERVIRLAGHELRIAEGDELQIFFSNRYTPSLVRQVLERHGLRVLNEWTSSRGNEGVFACTL